MMTTGQIVEVECERMTFRLYRDVFGDWRWEFRQADGEFIDSPASYECKYECAAAAAAARLRAAIRLLLLLLQQQSLREYFCRARLW